MLASLTAPDGPGGMEVVRKLMEQGNINIRSSKVPQAIRTNAIVMRGVEGYISVRWQRSSLLCWFVLFSKQWMESYT